MLIVDSTTASGAPGFRGRGVGRNSGANSVVTTRSAALPSLAMLRGVRRSGRGGPDGVAPAGDAELAVDGDRLRLDGIAGHRQLLGDLAERQMCREQREQTKLGRSQAKARARGREADRRHFVAQLAGARDE